MSSCVLQQIVAITLIFSAASMLAPATDAQTWSSMETEIDSLYEAARVDFKLYGRVRAAADSAVRAIARSLGERPTDYARALLKRAEVEYPPVPRDEVVAPLFDGRSRDAALIARLTEAAVDILQQELGPDHPELIDPLARLGSATLMLARWPDDEEVVRARSLFERALAIQRLRSPGDRGREIMLMQLLFQTLHTKADSALAVTLHHKASMLLVDSAGPESVGLVGQKALWAGYLAHIGHRASVLDLWSEIIAANASLHGEHSIEVLQGLHGISMIQRELDDLPGQIATRRRVVEIQRQRAVADSSLYHFELWSLASLLLSNGEAAEAATLFEQLLWTSLLDLGENRRDMYKELGDSYFALRDYSRSEQAYLRALSLAVPDESPMQNPEEVRREVLSALADVYVAQKRGSEAIALVDTLYNQRAAECGANVRCMLPALEIRARILRALGRTKNAVAIERRIARIKALE